VTDDLDCVMPVAGESTRMGRWKPLLPWDGKTVVQATVDHALSVCHRVILVAGYRGDEINALFGQRRDVEVVLNIDYSRGFLSSIQTGVQHVVSRRFFVALADMPLIRGQIYRSLLEARGGDVVRPYYQGKKGHPVLIDGHLIPAILDLPQTASMAEVLARVAVTRVETDDPSVCLDLDQPADYARLRPRETE
jgi:molybdenum cofactor cytidylyltransferase